MSSSLSTSLGLYLGSNRFPSGETFVWSSTWKEETSCYHSGLSKFCSVVCRCHLLNSSLFYQTLHSPFPSLKMKTVVYWGEGGPSPRNLQGERGIQRPVLFCQKGPANSQALMIWWLQRTAFPSEETIPSSSVIVSQYHMFIGSEAFTKFLVMLTLSLQFHALKNCPSFSIYAVQERVKACVQSAIFCNSAFSRVKILHLIFSSIWRSFVVSCLQLEKNQRRHTSGHAKLGVPTPFQF